MPRPLTERQSLEEERAELPGLIAAYQRELAETAITKTRREFLDWQIRNAQNRLAYVEARLATIRDEAN
jgi:hypothetical protein